MVPDSAELTQQSSFALAMLRSRIARGSARVLAVLAGGVLVATLVFLVTSWVAERSPGWAIWVLVPAVALLPAGFVSLLCWAISRGSRVDRRTLWNPYSIARGREMIRQMAGAFIPGWLVGGAYGIFVAEWLSGAMSMVLLPRNSDPISDCFATHGFLANPCGTAAQAAAAERLVMSILAAFLTVIALHAVGAVLEIRAADSAGLLAIVPGEAARSSRVEETHDRLSTSLAGIWSDAFGRNWAAGISAVLAPVGLLLTVSVLLARAGGAIDGAAAVAAIVGIINAGRYGHRAGALIALPIAIIGALYAAFLIAAGN